MSVELKEQVDLYVENKADHKWVQTTSITRVSTSGRNMLHYQAELPLDGSNRGYFVRIKDGNGNVVEDTYSQDTADSNPVEGTIQSNYLDFRSQIYTLEFGPYVYDKNVNAVGATVRLIQGRARAFESSTVFYDMNDTDAVYFSYNVPPSIFDTDTDVKIYLVEGKDVKDEGYAVGNEIFNVSRSSYMGNGHIRFNKALEYGKIYTLCMGIYSSVRQIAGNTFVWE